MPARRALLYLSSGFKGPLCAEPSRTTAAELGRKGCKYLGHIEHEAILAPPLFFTPAKHIKNV